MLQISHYIPKQKKTTESISEGVSATGNLHNAVLCKACHLVSMQNVFLLTVAINMQKRTRKRTTK